MPTLLEHPRRRRCCLFPRAEQRRHAAVLLEGKLSGLGRKTSGPIAHHAGVARKPPQSFVGWGAWDDELVMAQLRRHAHDGWADPDAALVVDGRAFPEKGTRPCGVARQPPVDPSQWK